jgi:hypothetical protein
MTMNQEIMNTEMKDPEEPKRRKQSGQRVAGFILGLIFGGLTILTYFLKASPSEFYATNKMILFLVLLGCGGFGALVGPGAMEKVGEWLSWIA